MAAVIDGVFGEELQNAIKTSKVLVVGAGGIGCEILKNLVLSGFPDIEIVRRTSIILSITKMPLQANLTFFYLLILSYFIHLEFE